MKLFTIGFTKKSAELFFTKLRENKVRKLIDVRLNNVSQLAGFAKRDDLKYLLREICNASYAHVQDLAPTQQMLDSYKKGGGTWAQYESEFMHLIRERGIAEKFRQDDFDFSCLLCSEDKPHFCHRRLVAEHLRETWNGVEIVHL